MVEHFVGRVAELWRYPVKSMLGERRNQLPITARGALGDRAWALRETATDGCQRKEVPAVACIASRV